MKETLNLKVQQFRLSDGLCINEHQWYFAKVKSVIELTIGDYTYEIDITGKILETRMNNSQLTMEGYCVKCKKKKVINEAKEMTMKNGRIAVTGNCPDCKTGMLRILGKQ